MGCSLLGFINTTDNVILVVELLLLYGYLNTSIGLMNVKHGAN